MWSVRAWLLLFFEVGLTIFSSGEVLSSSCPLELSPSSVVVRFGDPVSVNCTTSVDPFQKMGWEASAGTTTLKENRLVTWSVDSLMVWSIRPACYITIAVQNQCLKQLDVTIYKMPDTVSVLKQGPMQAGVTYQLWCNIINVAPVRNLTLTWWKGTELNGTEIFDNKDVTPQNISHSLSITPKKEDHGAQIRCKVQMNLGISGPQRTPISSEPHVMVVFYPPSVDPPSETLDLSVDNKPALNCSADGKPPPEYHFLSPAGVLEAPVNQAVFRPSSPLNPGTYNCTASNPLGSATKVFILQQPQSRPSGGMTAGIVVAVIVVLILAFVVWRKKSLILKLCSKPDA